MKVQELFNPVIGETSYAGFLNAVNTIKPITGTWINNTETGAVTVDVALVDRILWLKMRKKKLYTDFAEITADTYRDISDVLSARAYELEKLWDTLFLEWNPIENYDRIEDSTDDRTMNIGARSSSDTLGSRTDTSTVGNETASFEAVTDYNAKTTKSTDSATQGAQTNTSSSEAATDTDGTVHHARIHGNIGVMTSTAMLAEFRNSVAFDFYQRLVDVLNEEITNMNYEEE